MNRKDQKLIASLYVENVNQSRQVVDKMGDPITNGDEVAIPTKIGIEVVKVIAIDPMKKRLKVKGNEGKQIVVNAQDVIAFDTSIDHHAQEQNAIKVLRGVKTRY